VSFAQLLEEAFKHRQSLIVGRVQTRDRTHARKKYFHHYYGPNLIKLLFKVFQLPSEQALRSRYSYDFPLSAKDPMTNEIIIGEVEFYVVDRN
jgi:hypothetical protein